MRFLGTLFLFTLLMVPAGARADSLLLAQANDAYDPFVDYSEYEEASEEEADINFFRNGRFFTIGFTGGYRTFTDTLGSLYDDGYNFGFNLNYFFDLRFAMQFYFLTGDHTVDFSTGNGTRVNGTASLQTIGIGLKYYFNTQNVTRGLAELNPYVSGGFSQNTRTTTISGESAFGKEGATGFDFAAGIEIPMLRNKMYFGTQIQYSLVNFADEGSEIQVAGDNDTGIFPSGDVLQVNFTIGVNF